MPDTIASMIEILFRAEVKAADRSVFMYFIEWDACVAREKERKTGTLWFEYHEDPKDQNAFFVYEAYRDEAALEAHKQNDPYKKAWEPHIKPKVLKKFQPLFERGKAMDASERLAPNEEAVLKKINEQFAVMEQQRDAEAKAWFDMVLSKDLIFQRWHGLLVDKQAFLKDLDNPNPFASRQTKDIQIIALGDRALVFLVVHTTKTDGTVNRYRNIRLFSKDPRGWVLDRWWNYDVSNA